MNYYIFVNNEQQGPYTLEELRARHIASDTLVWRECMAQWTAAWQVDELRQLFQTAQPTPPPVQPQPTPDYTEPNAAATVPQPQAQKRSGCSKWLLGILVCVALAMFTLAATCPAKQDHQEAVKEEVNKLLEKATDSDDFFGAFGKMFTTSITSMAVDNLLDVHNYVLWSVGEVHYAGRTKKVSFGILNHVFTFDADDLERAMKGNTDTKKPDEENENAQPSTTDQTPVDTEADTTAI